MKHYIGLDVSLKTTAICIINEQGKIVFETTSKSTPDAIEKAILRAGEISIVQNKMDKLKSAQFISKFATENVFSEDQNRFIEIVKIEVSSLHEGNFARFKIRPSEFFEWQSSWK